MKILPKLPLCNIVTKVTENHTSFIYNNIFEDFPRRLYEWKEFSYGIRIKTSLAEKALDSYFLLKVSEVMRS